MRRCAWGEPSEVRGLIITIDCTDWTSVATAGIRAALMLPGARKRLIMGPVIATITPANKSIATRWVGVV